MITNIIAVGAGLEALAMYRSVHTDLRYGEPEQKPRGSSLTDRARKKARRAQRDARKRQRGRR